MTQLIQGQGEDAWTTVEEGWEPPCETTETSAKIPKLKARWTTDENNLSKFNARALNIVFDTVNDDAFKLILVCASAKQARDVLQKSNEGNSSVKRTRLDHLATRFENLRMVSNEFVSQFSIKLCVIANEAKNLGKTYKDHKLVKKLLRCLPPKYAAHKAVMKVSGNTNTLKFEDLVDMLKSEEMEVAEDLRLLDKGIIIKVDEVKNDQL
ncbi:hypothetical protein V5N11_008717 [Cardamine amara subsp. amara]|uniref:Gag-pol polyprotein n=1 Tax=Cardamine amara subsp. amara TaxID=228776 RepID=A0ABD0ZY91_CARAN